MNNSNYSILLVDESTEDREITKDLLIRQGYQVITVASRKAALESIEQSVPSLVLLDVVLPDGNGYDLCRTIKEYSNRINHYIPVILLTALHKLESKIEGLESGADDFLPKPPMPLELLARVRSLLRICSLQQNLQEANRRLSEANYVIEREMNRIGDLQRSFLPQSFPVHDNVELAACYHPSAEAGGDYYDAIPLDDNRWAIVMADIAGHGASAAVVMAITQMAVKEITPFCSSPQEALLRINCKLNGYLQGHHFVTMFFAVLELEEREMTYASAGHNPMLYYSFSQSNFRVLETEPSFPLCTFKTDGYNEYKRYFEPNDKMLLFTDGVLDVPSQTREFYGLERLSEALCKHGNKSPEELIEAVFQDTEAFRGDAKRLDDFTMMAINIK